MKKRILSGLLTSLLLFSLLPVSAFAAERGSSSFTFVPGLIPEESDFDYTMGLEPGDMPDYEVLPQKYDTRGGVGTYKAYQTAVKNQGSNGTCWTFGTYAAVEANAKKNDLGDLDFSEMHMAYATSNRKGNYRYGWNRTPGGNGAGGNRLYAAAYLMRSSSGFSGAVMESDDPYSTKSFGDRDLDVTKSKKISYQVQNIQFLTDYGSVADADGIYNIKSAIMSYGGVGASMFYTGDTIVGTQDETYFNKANNAYYYDRTRDTSGKVAKEGGTNHLVEIAGWDDNYPKTNFNASCQPDKDGAWLVKNSWGDDWGDQGYFWISYEDTNFPIAAFCIDGVKAIDPNETVYETDYKATGAGVGYAKEYTAYFAKVFTPNSNETLTSVRVMVNQASDISIDCVAYDTLMGNSYKFTARGSKAVWYPGWYTIDLAPEKQVNLTANSKFAVVVKLKTNSEGVYIAHDSSQALQSGINQALIPAHSDGTGWKEATGVATNGNICSYNFCIKAVTVPGTEKSGKTALTDALVTLNQDLYTYDGTAKKPVIQVNGKAVTDGADFTIEYRDNIDVETNTIKPSVTITATEGNTAYTGSITKNFTIDKARTTEIDKDGNKSVTVEKFDGSSVTKLDQRDGLAATVTTDTGGRVTVDVRLSEEAVVAARETHEPITLSIPAMTAAADWETAPVVTVKTGSKNPVKVVIPVADPTPGTVAVIVDEFILEVIKTSVPTEKGLVVSLSDGASVKIVDNRKAFADVPEWAADAVDFCFARALFSGTGKDTFSPDANMTKAMLVTVLARLDDVRTRGGTTWYERSMRWAVANGISDDSNPNGDVSREQLATMLWRYSGSPVPGGSLDGFTDAGLVSDSAWDAMRWAVENEIISDFGRGQLNPQGSVTRAQAAQILKDFIQKVLGRV